MLTNLKAHGVEDILIACIDGLKGFPEAVEAIFPKTWVQLCIVHQIYRFMKYVPNRNKKAVVADMKPIYQANNEQYSYEKLLKFEEKWGKNIL